MDTFSLFRKVVFTITLILIGQSLSGQKSYVCLTHQASGKAMLFEKGDYVYIAYDGYLGQAEGQAGYILQIDSTGLVLGKTMRPKSALKRIEAGDISGVRRLSAALDLAKALSVLAVSLTTYSVASNAGADRYLALTASVAAALGVQTAGNAIFPAKRPKYKISDGWVVTLLVI